MSEIDDVLKVCDEAELHVRKLQQANASYQGDDGIPALHALAAASDAATDFFMDYGPRLARAVKAVLEHRGRAGEGGAWGRGYVAARLDIEKVILAAFDSQDSGTGEEQDPSNKLA